MGERTSYAPGTFCWADLSTTDVDAAKAFYGALLGWEAEDLPVDESTVYSMQRRDGKVVAAIAPQPPQQRDAGVPPVWNSYILVESADAVAARAGELGGTVHAPPFDVMEAGRMAVIADPQGAFFLAWEPRQHGGAALVNATGALVWNELHAPDPDAAQRFYGDLFGWTFETFREGPEPYVFIHNAGQRNGGVSSAMAPGAPPHWLVYFGVDDVDAALAQIDALGGGTIAGPIDIQVARIAVVRDPQGAVFAIYAGQLDP
jgi:uncharacterized protein